MRTTKVLGFSVPPETSERFEKLSALKHKTKSEFFRELIDAYVKEVDSVDEKDLAAILKSYWQLRSKVSVKTLIVGLAVILNKDKKILIGARREKDEWVENLTWVFPGGSFGSLDFENDLKNKVKERTGLGIEVRSLVAARVHPDSGFKSVQIVALYFYCELVGKNKMKPGGDLKELKWVKPMDVFKFFTTSTCDEMTKFLTVLEKT